MKIVKQNINKSLNSKINNVGKKWIRAFIRKTYSIEDKQVWVWPASTPGPFPGGLGQWERGQVGDGVVATVQTANDESVATGADLDKDDNSVFHNGSYFSEYWCCDDCGF